MKITGLNLDNCQGLSKAYNFKPANLIVAPNASGKTALLDAVKLAMLGECVSGVDGSILRGKAAAEAMASDFPMGISVAFDDAATVRLSLAKKGRTFTLEHEPPEWLDERTRLLLNPDLYFGASGPERIKLLARCLSDRAMSDDELLAKFATAELPKASIAKEILDAKIAELRPVIAKHTILSAKIEAAGEALNAAKLESAAAAKRMTQTAAGVTDLAAIESGIADLPPLETVNATLAKLRGQKQDASNERERLREKARGRASDEQSAAALRELLGRDYAADLKATETQIASLESAIGIAEQDIKERRASVGYLEGRIREYMAQETALQQKSEMAEAEQGSGDESWHEGESNVPQERGIKVQIEGIGQTIQTGAIQVTEIVRWRLAPREPSKEETAAQESRDQQIAEIQMRQTDLAGQLETDLRSLEDNAAALRGVKSQHQQLVQKADATRKSIAGQAGATARLAALEKALVEVVRAPDSQDGVIAGLDDEIRQADAQRSRILELQQDRTRVEQSQAAAARVQTEAEVFAAMGKIGKALHSESADGGIDAALAVANRFCAGVLKTPLVYRDGEIGRMERGLFASKLSGSEAVVARMALSVALATKAKFRLVLLDELSTLDLDKKESLIRNLTQLQSEGLIDQFIAADNDVDFWKGETTVNIITP